MFRSCAVLAVTALLAAPAAFAGTGNDSAKDAQQLVTQATKVVDQIKSDSHFASLMAKAKGAFIIPSSGKGAFIVGGQGGDGVLVEHHNGTWSDPAFLSLGSISIGAQAGGEGGPVVMLLMTTKAVQSFTQSNNFSLNGNAGLTIVNYSAQGQAPVGKGDVIVWSNRSGAFAGASVSATDITSNTGQDQAYYGAQGKSTEAILNGRVHNSDAAKLIQALPA